ncbi:hypothetical protein [Streptomyces sp. NBC_01233]|uniref:hypothetical protein n=1 Tax=Streptomyces sp. NBC_01233 TaxID=2903787 RepID=UPI002E14637C|nr:hypothetical protein OG332_23935 [Streptomyces sp. NBC_01233]
MPVEPLPCADGGGTTPVEVVTCCAPSIASAPLCRADGTTVLLVVRSGCVECGEAAPDPVAVGWIDATTGVFTPGLLPADAGPCDAGCLDTVCRQLCDDTDGDGQADATYTELWCIRLDGTAELVLTYQDDPSVPYTPVSPVECTYGCPESETVTLCDETGPFLRRYTWLQGTATFEDFDLDGATPHVVTGTVGICAGSGEAAACCAPSTATTPLCRADGSTILLVVRSACGDCGEEPTDPQVVGWLDTAGVFTPGPAPDDADLCTSGCVDTVCRTRCDDTDGDGAADATYSELWCVQADGTATLVLTYQDDPSVPYTPVAPVDCEYGSTSSEVVPLCDEVGPFLRRYFWLGDAASFEDVALDGTTPWVVTGDVGVCSPAQECEAPTTPAATLGLCLADGTPIAVLVTRDCEGTVTQDGWLNLTTGTYAAGDPPVGTMACGNPRSISTTGTFCDVDPGTGDVLGLVLIEYTYGADGAVTAVRLVDATTGTNYVPQGEVTTCPAGVAQPERDIVQLCDVAGDGTVTEFVRDYARDENGAIVGHTDYLLDGTPYAVAGTVGVCSAQSTCLDCTSQVLCDSAEIPAATITGAAASGTLSNGVAYAVTGPSAFPPTTQNDGAAWWGVALFPNPSVPLTTYTFDQPVTAEFSVVIVHTTSGATTGRNQVQIPAGAVPISLPTGYSYNAVTRVLTGDASLVACPPLQTPTRANSARFRISGVSTFALQYMGPRVLLLQCQRFGNWVFGAVDVTLGGQFLRTVCRDCTGAVTSTTDTLLDGSTPYTPVGAVGVCPIEEEGAEPVEPDTEVVQLCDLVDGVDPVPFLRRLTFPAGGGTPTVTDTTLNGTTPYALTGTAGLCTAAEDCPAHTVIQMCRCDDADGDGIADTDYVELLALDCEGVLTSIGTYTAELDAPYVPVAPIDCAETDEGAESVIGVQARRIELAVGANPWDAEVYPTLQSVTAVAHGGTGTVTTTDGPSTLHSGEAATWSVGRDVDAALTGPLTITANSGTVTITWTQGVTL